MSTHHQIRPSQHVANARRVHHHQAPRTIEKTSMLTKLKNAANNLQQQQILVKKIIQLSKNMKAKALHCQQQVMNHSTNLSIQESNFESFKLNLNDHENVLISKLSAFNQVEAKQAEHNSKCSTFLSNTNNFMTRISTAIEHQKNVTNRVHDGVQKLEDAKKILQDRAAKLQNVSDNLKKEITVCVDATEQQKQETKLLMEEEKQNFATIAITRENLSNIKKEEASLTLQKVEIQNNIEKQTILMNDLVTRESKCDKDYCNLQKLRDELDTVRKDLTLQNQQLVAKKNELDNMNEKENMNISSSKVIELKLKQTVLSAQRIAQDVDQQNQCASKLSELDSLLTEQQNIAKELNELQDKVKILKHQEAEKKENAIIEKMECDKKETMLNEKRNLIHKSSIQIQTLQTTILNDMDKVLKSKRNELNAASVQFQQIQQNKIISFDQVDQNLKILMEQFGELNDSCNNRLEMMVHKITKFEKKNDDDQKLLLSKRRELRALKATLAKSERRSTTITTKSNNSKSSSNFDHGEDRHGNDRRGRSRYGRQGRSRSHSRNRSDNDIRLEAINERLEKTKAAHAVAASLGGLPNSSKNHRRHRSKDSRSKKVEEESMSLPAEVLSSSKVFPSSLSLESSCDNENSVEPPLPQTSLDPFDYIPSSSSAKNKDSKVKDRHRHRHRHRQQTKDSRKGGDVQRKKMKKKKRMRFVTNSGSMSDDPFAHVASSGADSATEDYTERKSKSRRHGSRSRKTTKC